MNQTKLLNSLQDIFNIIGEPTTPLMQDCLQIMKAAARQEQEESAKRSMEKIMRIQNGINFELIIIFKKPFIKDLLVDFIPLEGVDNAIRIYQEYRRIGHSLGLYSLTLNLNNEKIKKVYFKY